jgi:hypothetical protein
MKLVQLLNLGLRFLLEVCALLIFGYWGFKTGGNPLMKFLLGLGAPLLVAVVWGTFLAPKSALRLPNPWLFLLELVIFALACWALYSAGSVNLSIAFGALYIFNKILMLIWRQS